MSKELNFKKSTIILVSIITILLLFFFGCVDDNLAGEAAKNICGDNKCRAGETYETCPEDCDSAADNDKGKPAANACSDHLDNDGDGYCDYSWKKASCDDGSIVGDTGCLSKDDNDESCIETPEVCDGLDNDCDGLVDENACPVCGDNVCDADESCSNCAVDCGACTPFCGDNQCNLGESCESCPGDCGQCTNQCTSATLAETLSSFQVQLPVASKVTTATADQDGNTVIPFFVPDNREMTIMTFDKIGNKVRADIVTQGIDHVYAIEATPTEYGLLVGRNTGGTLFSLFFVRMNFDGQILSDEMILGPCDLNDDPNCEYLDSKRTGTVLWDGSMYHAYFGYFAKGHQQDRYLKISQDGKVAEVVWSLGLGHSQTQELVMTPAGNVQSFGVSDCYPQNGIYFGRSPRIWYYENAQCATFYQWIGNTVSVGSGFWIPFIEYDYLLFREVGLLHVTDAAEVDYQSWLTENSMQGLAQGPKPAYTQLAEFEGNLVMAWDGSMNDYRTKADNVFVKIDKNTGQEIGVRETLNANLVDYGQFISYPNGDIGWVSWEPVDFSLYNVYRLSECE